MASIALHHNAVRVARVAQSAAAFVLAVLLSAAAAEDRPADESPDGPEAVKVYLAEEEALAMAFPGADSVRRVSWEPTQLQRRAVERRLGWRLDEGPFPVFVGYAKGAVTGYATIGEEVGLYKPITFLVKVTIEGKVDGVWVLVYRESRGDEVRRRRFLSQYEGKTARSPIRINRDMIGITGATMSVRALNAGVKKAVTLIHAGFLHPEGG